MDPRQAEAAERMIEQQIVPRGLRDGRVLAAMRSVPRVAFVPPELEELAYDDRALPIGAEQTISQPYIVALMAAALALNGHERVLEIGTGSGYSAAVLSRLADAVYTVERQMTLAMTATARLRRLGYHNVFVRHGDGTLGWPEHAPYDAIVIAAGGPKIPEALVAQLAHGGRLVMPLKTNGDAQLITVAPDGSLRQELLDEVRFVPLIGAQGWSEDYL